MTKIAIISDLHANFPALKEILKKIEEEKCDHIYHLGDTIAMGPHPNECVELLVKNDVKMIMGNHEEYYVFDSSKNQPEHMSCNELIHQEWTNSRLSPEFKKIIDKLPYETEEQFHNTKITFMHCPYGNSNGTYKDFLDLRFKHAKDLDEIFANYDSDIICYGHTHIFSDIEGDKRYINPGSVGCHAGDHANLTIIEINESSHDIIHHKVPYDKAFLRKEMFEKSVPDKEFICENFFMI